jgi:hypothetical protein
MVTHSHAILTDRPEVGPCIDHFSDSLKVQDSPHPIQQS